VSVRKVLDAAQTAAAMCGAPKYSARGRQNPGARLGAALGALALRGKDKLTLRFSEKVSALGGWIEQLIAESTGKDGKGILPVVGEPEGGPEVYREDRVFAFVTLGGDREESVAPHKAGAPLIRLTMNGVYELGAQFFIWEMATAIAAHVMGVHPFNQPNVDQAKAWARELLEQYSRSGSLPREEACEPDASELSRFLEQAEENGYVATQAYVTPCKQMDSALRRLGRAVSEACGLPATVGYGPRFLHSTGQLHKGDSGRGLFVQLISRDVQDLPIPDAPGSDSSSITFGAPKLAQAMGDRKVLSAEGRKVLTFRPGPEPEAELTSLAAALTASSS